MITTCGECPFFNGGKAPDPGQRFGRCDASRDKRVYRVIDQDICSMFKKTTLPEALWPLMQGKTLKLKHCAICGTTSPLNEHHIVRRGAGKLIGKDGRERQKPTITLCGSGTTGCHGLAHQMRLHFRWKDGWEYLITQEPTDYWSALEQSGWRRIEEQTHSEMVEIQTRCAECRWVMTGGGRLWCGHPSLTVSVDWVTPEDEVEPLLPVEEDGFCSKGEWCGRSDG